MTFFVRVTTVILLEEIKINNVLFWPLNTSDNLLTD